MLKTVIYILKNILKFKKNYYFCTIIYFITNFYHL